MGYSSDEFRYISSEDLEKILWHYSELERLFGESVAEDDLIFAINNELEAREITSGELKD